MISGPEYLVSLVSYLCIIPAAVLCFAPMLNSLKFERKAVFLRTALVLAVFIPSAALAEQVLNLSSNQLYTPVAVLFFFLYHSLLNINISQSAAVYSFVYALMTFLINFSALFDALTHPASDLEHFSLEGALFRLFLSSFICLLGLRLFRKYGGWLIEHFTAPDIWWSTLVIFLLFILYNLGAVIHYYETLYVNTMMRGYIFTMFIMFILLIMFCLLFYFTVRKITDQEEQNSKLQLLEMQEKQFLAQQRYLEDTAKARHDFKHVLRTLQQLSSEENYEGMKSFLDEYSMGLPENEVVGYCDNYAVNATLNHYVNEASHSGIKADLRISLPPDLKISDSDLCSILGNILENAITACKAVTEDDRMILLTVIPVGGNEIYIAAENDHNGTLINKGSRYFSTKKGNTGIGLVSVSSLAEKYDGYATFSHDERKFYSNVFLRNDHQRR